MAIVQTLKTPVEFEWVPREENTEADKIANQCLDQHSTVGLKLTLTTSTDRSSLQKKTLTKKNRKTRRVQFSLDEKTYTAFQKALRANKSTTTKMLVDAVKHYLKS